MDQKPLGERSKPTLHVPHRLGIPVKIGSTIGPSDQAP